jgi:hypothetical protein
MAKGVQRRSSIQEITDFETAATKPEAACIATAGLQGLQTARSAQNIGYGSKR